jgi:hypothetical protein
MMRLRRPAIAALLLFLAPLVFALPGESLDSVVTESETELGPILFMVVPEETSPHWSCIVWDGEGSLRRLLEPPPAQTCVRVQSGWFSLRYDTLPRHHAAGMESFELWPARAERVDAPSCMLPCASGELVEAGMGCTARLSEDGAVVRTLYSKATGAPWLFPDARLLSPQARGIPAAFETAPTGCRLVWAAEDADSPRVHMAILPGGYWDGSETFVLHGTAGEQVDLTPPGPGRSVATTLPARATLSVFDRAAGEALVLTIEARAGARLTLRNCRVYCAAAIDSPHGVTVHAAFQTDTPAGREISHAK